MKNTALILLSLTLLIFSTCTSRKIPKDFDYGKIEKNRYSNNFFNMRIDLPDSWYVQTKSESDSLLADGMKLISKNQQEAQKTIEVAKVTSATLLSMFRVKPGTNLDYDQSLMILAENLGNNLLVTSGADYLKASKNQLKKTNMKYFFLDESYPKMELGGKKFHVMRTRIDYQGVNIYQNYYATVMNGFAFLVIQSWNTPDQKEGLDKIIKTLYFKE